MKIQDLAAMIGGIVKICMVLGELICKFFIEAIHNNKLRSITSHLDR